MALRLSSNQGHKLQAHIRRSETELRKQYRNLVTGKRFNEAADDLGRTSQVENFEIQIRGYTRAARNAYEGISVARTGDSVLAESSNLIEKMRSLALQSASDTYSDEDRLLLNDNFGELLQGLKFINRDTEIFDRKVMGGEFLGKHVQIGLSAFDSIRFDIHSLDPVQYPRSATKNGNPVTAQALSSGELKLNDVGIRASLASDDELSTTLKSASAVAKAAAINDFTQHTGVRAEVLTTKRVGLSEVQAGRLDLGHELFVNGIRFSGIDVTLETEDELVLALNDAVDQTGVVASKDANNRLVLTAVDGRNIEIKTTGNAHTITGLRATQGSDVTLSGLRITSQETIFVSGALSGITENKVGLVTNDIIGKANHQVVTTLDVSSRESASLTIETLDLALEELLQARAYLGGLENRLGATVNRLNQAGQNAYISKNQMTDTDYAAETAALARNQVLRQSYTSMLKQSNRLPSRILELL